MKLNVFVAPVNEMRIPTIETFYSTEQNPRTIEQNFFTHDQDQSNFNAASDIHEWLTDKTLEWPDGAFLSTQGS